MKESVLKKQFGKNDVQRLRNLIQGKYGDKIRSSIGYAKKIEVHNEGDIWVEDEREWTIKDGIKQNITKLDEAKELYKIPLFCPKCKNIMKNRNDKDFYNIHKKCYNCVIDMEIQLRKEGKWKEYEINIHNNEIDNKIQEFRLWIKSRKEETTDSFISEGGHLEKWVGQIDEEKVNIYEQETIEYLLNLKKQC